MLLLGKSLNTALLFLVPISAIPLPSRVLNPAAVPNANVSSPQFNSTNPVSNLDSPAYQVLCFDIRASLDLTAVAQDCTTVLNDVILRLDGPFERRPFSEQMYMESYRDWLPARWIFGQCSVYVNSAPSASIDLFTLFEVALTANKILSDCVTSHRKAQGGSMPIGSRVMSYYVGLQGYLPDVNVNAVNDADISTLPNSEVSKRTPNANLANRGPAGLQPRMLGSNGALVSLNETRSQSNSTGDPKVQIGHEIDCYPRGSRLPGANAKDCKFIINTIILGMKDPLRAQTWGYTDTAEINVSLPENRWIFGNCFMRVRNIDEKQVDRFRPVDVAEVAQRIVQKCVADTKEPLGGNADIGRLKFPLSFYVVVSGIQTRSGESLGSDTTLSLPSGGPRILESRSSPIVPEHNSLSMTLTDGLKARKRYPVHCFDPASVHRLLPAIASDCNVIINEIILRLPNPMMEQTFGYTDAADINIMKTEYNNWHYGQCVVFIKNNDESTIQDRFRFLDVASTVNRILDRCLDGSKFAIGGIADVGTAADKFYVGVSGFGSTHLRNGTILEVPSGTGVSSPSSAISASPPRNRTVSTPSYEYSGTESANLDKRSSNTTKYPEASGRFAPLVRCLGSGMPAAQKINTQDCTDAVMVLLSDPKILVPQLFTTEPTGGIEMPFVQHSKSCYLMMDTSLDLSISDYITLLKMVYWASEIMLRCICGREQGFGGISTLDADKGIFVSVTGVDLTTVRNGLASLSDESTSAISLENSSLQIVDLGQS
ncbi:hypothetical protein HO173_005167 [Letharia columbiana]|uniref:Uncharacterized protein n=1 Tax=Letharia columbiana TaxID=112416 RepID=A0A8H6L626_9LECA|nr:uncharacterized protein HO173_005167 [Letharia columbiana]KAF6236876.1 hypothetical protein HO173_005167 [Letharia columbiana]